MMMKLVTILAFCLFLTRPGSAWEFHLVDAQGQAANLGGNTVAYAGQNYKESTFTANIPQGASSLLNLFIIERTGDSIKALSPGITIAGETITINIEQILNELYISRGIFFSAGTLYVAESRSVENPAGGVNIIGADGLVVRRIKTVANPHALVVDPTTLFVASEKELAAYKLADGTEIYRVELPYAAQIGQLAIIDKQLFIGERATPAVHSFDAATGVEQGILIAADLLNITPDLSNIGLAVTTDKHLLVNDSLAVHEFTIAAGKATLVRKIVDVAGGMSLAVDQAGNIAVAIIQSRAADFAYWPEVWVFDSTGKKIRRVVRPYLRGPADYDGKLPDSLYKMRVSAGPGSIRTPGGVCFDEQNRLYISDSLRWARSNTEFYLDSNRLELNGGVVCYSADGELIGRLGSRFTDGFSSKARLAARADRLPLLRTSAAIKNNMLKILAWGDSISQCGNDWNGGASSTAANWVHVLARNLEEKHEGLKIKETAEGIGGQNTAESLCRDPVEYINSRGNYDLLLIQLGTNDQAFHLQTPAQFADNLRQMLTLVITAYDCDIVMITPGPLPVTKAADPPETYIRAMQQVGKEFNVPVIDMTTGINDIIAANNKTFADYHKSATDCHPNDLGHLAWATVVENFFAMYD